ncbi:hypothetical protein [Halapricum desulfuricans]|uniref:Uncharacterized protein n=1 Tax=Halapricum desulfuricans TaxID=2841257 RepID=A0A897MTH8_9EURY|nr:hypothetical protein [Halapricum desulfuricans]QSG05440.1 hypothetical protein HSR121_1093 [Halapricum desulfuricans]
MADVSLDLDPAMIDNLRREADEHGFEDLDGYVEWLLGHRDTVLGEHDVWNSPPGGDFDADLGQSSGPSLDPDRPGVDAGTTEASSPESDTAGGPSLEPDRTERSSPEPDSSTQKSDEPSQDEQTDEDDVALPDEDGADDDDVAAALEDLDLDE